jgi:hypothetical protein
MLGPSLAFSISLSLLFSYRLSLLHKQFLNTG